MNLYILLEQIKKSLRLTNSDLGAVINKNGDAFRKALKRGSLSDYELLELAKAIMEMKKHETPEQTDLVMLFENEIKKKIQKTKSLILDKILTEEQEQELKERIKGDPAYFDLKYRKPIEISEETNFLKEEGSQYKSGNECNYLKELVETQKLTIELLKNENERLKEEKSNFQKDRKSSDRT